MDKNTAYIEKAKKIYGKKFDYSKTNYQNARTKIIIICKKHGEYLQLPLNHLRQNCPKCTKQIETLRKKNNFENFKSKLTKEKLLKYDYSKLKVYGYNDIGIFICPFHGLFRQKIKNHIESNGCYKCGRKSFSDLQKTSYNDIILKIKTLPPSIKVNLEKNRSYAYKDIIKCSCKIHGEFKKSLQDLFRGISCVKCRYKGYSRTSFVSFCKAKNKKKVTLYFIKIYDNKEIFYKIGITSNTVKIRFKHLYKNTKYKFEIIQTIEGTPLKIWNLENKIKKEKQKFLYRPKKYFTGYTECFTKELLDYDI